MASLKTHTKVTLAALPRRQLQDLAKEHGVKANMKSNVIVDKLLELKNAGDDIESHQQIAKVDSSPITGNIPVRNRSAAPATGNSPRSDMTSAFNAAFAQNDPVQSQRPPGSSASTAIPAGARQDKRRHVQVKVEENNRMNILGAPDGSRVTRSTITRDPRVSRSAGRPLLDLAAVPRTSLPETRDPTIRPIPQEEPRPVLPLPTRQRVATPATPAAARVSAFANLNVDYTSTRIRNRASAHQPASPPLPARAIPQAQEQAALPVTPPPRHESRIDPDSSGAPSEGSLPIAENYQKPGHVDSEFEDDDPTLELELEYLPSPTIRFTAPSVVANPRERSFSPEPPHVFYDAQGVLVAVQTPQGSQAPEEVAAIPDPSLLQATQDGPAAPSSVSEGSEESDDPQEPRDDDEDVEMGVTNKDVRSFRRDCTGYTNDLARTRAEMCNLQRLLDITRGELNRAKTKTAQKLVWRLASLEENIAMKMKVNRSIWDGTGHMKNEEDNEKWRRRIKTQHDTRVANEKARIENVLTVLDVTEYGTFVFKEGAEPPPSTEGEDEEATVVDQPRNVQGLLGGTKRTREEHEEDAEARQGSPRKPRRARVELEDMQEDEFDWSHLDG